jgi:hypothetical protein
MRDPLEDLRPGEEAEAQNEETVMPWVWGAVGLLVVALFVAWAVFAPPHATPPAVPATTSSSHIQRG